LSHSRVLVSGGAGFIGSHLVDELIRGRYQVTVLDDLSNGVMKNLGRHLNDEKLDFVKGDIRDEAVVDKALQNVEAVIHLAAIVSIPFSVEYPKVTYEVNVEATRSLLEASLANNVDKFIYVSSCAVYGEPKYLPIDENHPTDPASPYAESKLKAEQVCLEFREANDLKVTILRPFNVFGPRQRKDQYGGVVARFIERLHEGRPPVIYGDGLQTRDFVYVKDAARAFMLALNGDGSEGRIFNVATGVPTSINHLAKLLMELFGIEGVEPEYADAREGDIMHSYADVKQAKVHLGFEPRISLRDGLLDLISVQAKEANAAMVQKLESHTHEPEEQKLSEKAQKVKV